MKQMMLWTLVLIAGASAQAPMKVSQGTPVLVELFTSEGCSSCPPADLLLQELDSRQPVPAAGIIVMSEHVDYWDHAGWKDPYSSHGLTARQQAYVGQFHLPGAYTPQMVVDGGAEFVGSARARALSAIASAAHAEKVAVRMRAVGSGIRIEVDPLPSSAGSHEANVYFAAAEDPAASQVLRGENRGRTLRHVAVVRRLTRIGGVSARAPFMRDLPAAETGVTRQIAFVQDAATGRVWGAAMLPTLHTGFP